MYFLVRCRAEQRQQLGRCCDHRRSLMFRLLLLSGHVSVTGELRRAAPQPDTRLPFQSKIYEKVVTTLTLKVGGNSLLCLFCCLQPNFGASLHILKVEIGGDSQTTGD